MQKLKLQHHLLVHQVESWLLHFQSSFLLLHLGSSGRWPKYMGPTTHVEDPDECWAPNFTWPIPSHCSYLGNELTDERSLSTSLSLILSFSVPLCHSAFQINLTRFFKGDNEKTEGQILEKHYRKASISRMCKKYQNSIPAECPLFQILGNRMLSFQICHPHYPRFWNVCRDFTASVSVIQNPPNSAWI